MGTRSNPAAIGAQIQGGSYTITINSVNLDDTSAVMAANPFNAAPDDGTTYALINATVTYTGKDSGNVGDVGFAYVTSSGNVIDSSDAFVVVPDPALEVQELYSGASVTGNVVIQVPAGDNGLIRVRPGFLADEIFIAAR